MSAREERCGFCKKSRKLVERLIEGPSNNYICDECIELCHNLADLFGHQLGNHIPNNECIVHWHIECDDFCI